MSDFRIENPSSASGSGDVVGPASSVDGKVVLFDGVSGKLIKDSGLALSGTNTGDQTSIVGITGTKAQFDTAVSDGNILYVGDAPTAHATSHKLGGGDAIRLDEFAAPTASVNFSDQQALSFRIENRTSDPGSPSVGQVWLRTDL